MCEERGADVERQAAEENGKQGHPFEVFDEGGEEGVGAEAVAEDGKGNVAQAGKDDY